MPSEIAGLLDRRSRRRAHRHAELVADHVRQRRLAEAGRSVQQHVIERRRRAASRRQSRRAGSRGRGPGRCSRRGRAGAGRLRTARPRRRARRSQCGSVLTLVSYFASSRSACFSVRSKPPSRPADFDGRIDGFLGERPMIPQVHQRREQIVAQHGGPPRRRPPPPRLPLRAGDPSARGRCARTSSCRRRESPSAARGRRARSRG